MLKIDDFKVGDYAEVIDVPVPNYYNTGRFRTITIGNSSHVTAERIKLCVEGDIVEIKELHMGFFTAKVCVVLGENASNRIFAIKVNKLRKINFKENESN